MSVTLHTETIIILNTSLIYDIKEKKKLEFSTIFSSKDNFDKLAEVVKSKTSEILREKIRSMQELTDDDKKVL